MTIRSVFSGLLAAALLAVPHTLAGAPGSQASTPAETTRLEVAPGTVASYRVREQLVGVNFPNDAVGRTEAVSGTIVIGPDNRIVSAESRLTIDLATLKSDQDRRDNYLRNRTLETEKYPEAVFVPREIRGLASPLPIERTHGFELVGDMTMRGTTREVVWQVVGQFSETEVGGRATTSFRFADFNIEQPSVSILLSVEDDIRLEIDFRFIRQTV